MSADKNDINRSNPTIELFEHAFKELKEDIQELRREIKEDTRDLKKELKESNKERIKEIKELRKEIFGNGDKGMCTQRQDILKTWVLKEIGVTTKEILNKVLIFKKEITYRLDNISETPKRIYNIIWKILAMIGLVGSTIAIILKFVEIKIK